MTEINLNDLVAEVIKKNPNALYRAVMPFISEIRKMQIDRMPALPLLPLNVRNCVGLLNRQVLMEHMPKNGVCVELGVDEGFFTKAILKFTSPSKLYLVDLWGDDRFNESKYESVCQKFSSQINAGLVEVVRRPSIEAAETFEDSSLDWIYIDTDHSYETTRQELRAYARKIKNGGLIAGHDYCMGNWIKGFKYGVIEAVHEFCLEENWEFVFVTLDFTENQSFAIKKING